MACLKAALSEKTQRKNGKIKIKKKFQTMKNINHGRQKNILEK